MLDPTCGSGAFLFAALRILETLYSDCLQGMASFLDDPDVPLAADEQLKAIIARGENDRCEFKSTMRHCIRTAQAPMPEDKRKEVLRTKDKDRNHDVLKSVAAMLNTGGGDVVVGVQDDGTIYGLEADYAYFSKDSERNPDGYELWMRQLFVNHFGVLNSQKVRAQFVTLEGKQVLWLRVLPAETAAYVVAENKQKIFYIRNGNETRALEIEQVVAYHQTRFTPEAIKALPVPAPEPVVKSAKKKRFEDFRAVLAQIAHHPSERYFVLKSIIINNLFGVDIMEEAVEICKLRLFLKLVAQVETVGQIEPLPDIDFNIRAGNTLVGYVSIANLRESQKGTFGFASDEIEQIEEDALIVEKSFQQFRAQQTTHGGKVTTKDKQELRRRLQKLDAQLNLYLAAEYGVVPEKYKGKGRGGFEQAFTDWNRSHQPFHWFVEFYGIMRSGGFDVIIGNPPYVEWHKVTEYGVLPNTLMTRDCGNLYAAVLERSFGQSQLGGRIGMIVQLSAICTDRMQSLQVLYRTHSASVWASCYDDRPGKLFDGLQHIRATIILSETAAGVTAEVLTTNLMRWPTETRDTLFSRLHYGPVTAMSMSGSFPKAAEPQLVSLLNRMWAVPTRLERVYDTSSQHIVYYYRSPLYWIRAMNFLPHFSSGTAQRSVHHFKDYPVTDPSMAALVGCLINSTTFYIWFVAYGNGRNVTLRDISTLPVPESLFSPRVAASFVPLFKRLMDDYRKHSIVRTRRDGVEFQEFAPGKSKQLMDEIDFALAEHYGFTAEELDFIINYDIKYRMGQNGDNDGDE